MEDKQKNELHLRFEELFAKRQRLADLRNKVIQSRKSSHESKVNKTETTEQPSTSGFVPRTRSGTPENVIQDLCNNAITTEQPSTSGFVPRTRSGTPKNIIQDDGKETYFDDSDDSVKDKNYQPDEDDYSSCSHISDSPESTVTQRRIAQAKRRLFSTEKLTTIPTERRLASTDAEFNPENNTDLISLEELLGTQKSSFGMHDGFCVCHKCILSSPNKQNRVQNTVDQVSDPPVLVTEGSCSNDVVCFGNLDDTRLCDKNAADILITENNHLTSEIVMTADSNGTIYLPNYNFPISSMEHDMSMPQKVKKKKRDPMKWKRNAAKFARLKGSPYHSSVAKKKQDVDGRILQPPCSCKFKCFEKISHEKRQLIFDQFWKSNRNWEQRRQFIVNNIDKKKKRIMKTDGNFETDRRKFTYIYNLSTDHGSLRVCKVMFLNTLSIGEKFVKVSLGKQLEGGLTAADQRGKHVPANKSPEPVVQSVIDHINSYPVYESHYSRQKSERKFLGPDLNIAIMYRHYQELMESKRTPANLVAKDWLYRNIFNTKFNLSFKLPSVDTCDDCDAYERKLRDCTTEIEKEEIEKEKEVHNKAAEVRYNLKRIDKQESIASSGKKKVLMFDLQKCLPTPNLTNSKSFYLRKLWTLNLTIHDATSNVGTNVIWSENISGRGGNEVASCLIRWADENISKIASLEELTLWSDNCAGQNRNLMVVMAYMWLLYKLPQLKIINHKFMLKGHTHMEVDQIHSQIERKKKQLKTMQIAIPRDWSQFIRTCGGKRPFEVYDMELQHFKDVTALYKKNGPFVSRKKNKDGKDFKISECVWLQVKRDQPGVLFYKNHFSEDFTEVSLVRNAAKGVTFPNDLPQIRQSEKPISTAKFNDLITLLQWIPAQFHNYFKSLKHSNNENDFPESD